MIFKSKLLSSLTQIEHAFGTKSEPVSNDFLTFWNNTHPSWKQVHGIEMIQVTNTRQQCGEVDGMYTFEENTPIGVVTADCVPLLFAKKNGCGLAAIHAGWRGTYQGIVDRLWDTLKLKNENPKDWVCAMGPAILSCCFEVSEDLVTDFEKRFPGIEKSILSPTFRHLDLHAIHRHRLIEIGFLPECIETLNFCTRCSNVDGNPVFSSYRRDQNSDRQWSIIFSKA